MIGGQSEAIGREAETRRNLGSLVEAGHWADWVGARDLFPSERRAVGWLTEAAA